MKYSELSAIELQREIDRADSEDSGTMLPEALKEVDRLRGLLIDIVDICNTDPVTFLASSTTEDYDKVLIKIDDIAHRYFAAS